MKRINNIPRTNLLQKLEQQHFLFAKDYWNESAYYQFSLEEINKIEKASNELWEMCLETVQWIIDNKAFEDFELDLYLIPQIIKSWEEDHHSIYGRFDLGYDGNSIKLFEFNADTPTSLYEASVIQWNWLEETHPNGDQFNSIHDKILAYFDWVKTDFTTPLYFTCIKDSLEDFTTVEYLRDLAHQSGISTYFIYIEDIGWDGSNYLDLENNPIHNLFKLYPWEWFISEPFGKWTHTIRVIEPAWKALLSNKMILVYLTKLYPNHPLLLSSYKTREEILEKTQNWVEKPIYSREGANVTLVKSNNIIEETSGDYEDVTPIYQEMFDLPNFDGNYPIIGSWIIAGESAGIGIRENKNLITDNLSKFVPHIIS
jgi:glutathionylspermidine synthase